MTMQKLDNYTKSLLESFSDKVFYAVVETITIILMPLLSIFVGVSSASATRTVNTISGEVTISPSLNVTIPSNTVVLTLNPLNTDFGSANLNVTVSTNNPAGYTLSMAPTTANQTSLIRVSGTETIPTLTEKTGGYTESEFTTNAWGYKLSNTNYLTFNNTNEIITTNTPSNNDTSIVTFAAKADNTQAAGTYQLEITFTAIANPLPEPTTTPGKITYNPNSGTVIGEMGDQTVQRARDWSSCYDTDLETYCYDSEWNEIDIDTLPLLDYYQAILYAPNFKNPGHGFAGWNTKPDHSGKMYGPNGTINLTNEEASTGIVLYATWVASEGSLQSDGARVCSGLTRAATDGTATLASVAALTDNRDGNTYAIARLADNKCWMIENLRLDDSADLTAVNTNSPALPLTNTDGTTSNHLSPTTNPYQTDWCTLAGSAGSACLNQSMVASNNTTLFTNNSASSYDIASDVYSYGNYYNWYSATAGNGKYDFGSGNVAGSICPNGWRLPTGGDTAGTDYYVLDISLGGTGSDARPWSTPSGIVMSNAYRSFPTNLVFSGTLTGDGIGSRSLGNDYWSSTARAKTMARGFRIYISDSYTSRYMNKYAGFTVRCLAGS